MATNDITKTVQYRYELRKNVEENKDKIIKMYLDEKIPISDIALKFNCKKHFIWQFLTDNGIEIRPYYPNKYKVDENYFEKIDSHEKAYFLGLLASDGYIGKDHTVSIGLHPKDIDILEKFKKCIKSDAPIKFYENKNTERLKSRGGKSRYVQKIARFRFKNKKIMNDLQKLGITCNKSLTLQFPDINQEYYYSFMRGYIDGDGCICVYKDKKRGWIKYALVIISSKPFIQKMLEIFKDDDIKFGVKKAERCENTYRADAGNKTNIVKFLDKVYENCGENIFLNRKHKKYVEMKSLLEQNPVNPKMVTNLNHTHNI